MPRVASAGACLLALTAIALAWSATSPQGDSARADAGGVPAGTARFYLALWRGSSVWDPEARATLHPGSPPVEIQFGSEPVSRRSTCRTSPATPSGR